MYVCDVEREGREGDSGPHWIMTTWVFSLHGNVKRREGVTTYMYILVPCQSMKWHLAKCTNSLETLPPRLFIYATAVVLSNLRSLDVLVLFFRNVLTASVAASSSRHFIYILLSSDSYTSLSRALLGKPV